MRKSFIIVCILVIISALMCGLTMKESGMEEKYSSYLGEWVSPSQDLMLTFFEDKHGTIAVSNGKAEKHDYQVTSNFLFEYCDTGFCKTIPWNQNYIMDNFLGVPCLVTRENVNGTGSECEVRYFREEDISKIVERIEITADNFLEYFEFGPVVLSYCSNASFIPEPQLDRYLLIRDKYKNLACVYSYADIKLTADLYWHEFEAKWDGEKFDIHEVRSYPDKASWGGYSFICPGGYNISLDVDNLVELETMQPYSTDATLCWGCAFGGTMLFNDPTLFRPMVFEISEVIEASGTLLLYKEVPGQ